MRVGARGPPVHHHRHAADAVGRRAVGALAGSGARRLLAEPAAVGRTRLALDARDRSVDAAVHDLVAPNHEHHAPRAEYGRRHAVAVAVDVHEPAVGGERIRAREEEVARKLVPHYAHLLLRLPLRVAVPPYLLARRGKRLGKSKRRHRHAAAETDALSVRDQLHHASGGGGPRREAPCGEPPLAQGLGNLFKSILFHGSKYSKKRHIMREAACQRAAGADAPAGTSRRPSLARPPPSAKEAAARCRPCGRSDRGPLPPEWSLAARFSRRA